MTKTQQRKLSEILLVNSLERNHRERLDAPGDHKKRNKAKSSWKKLMFQATRTEKKNKTIEHVRHTSSAL